MALINDLEGTVKGTEVAIAVCTCQAQPHLVRDDMAEKRYQVVCPGCGMAGPGAHYGREAVLAWNRTALIVRTAEGLAREARGEDETAAWISALLNAVAEGRD